ncbi:MAG: acyl--CoA ligase [Sphingomonadales bacterium]|nr:acyl--CoA ligase [Sphingomonadales bacterium]
METRSELHWNRMQRCFADRPASISAHLAGVFRARGDALALVDGEARVSFAALDLQVRALAAALARCGVTRGDRVAIMLGNDADAIRAVLAVLWLGAVVVPVGTRSRAPEIAYLLGDAQACLVIHAPEFRPELPSSMPLALETGSSEWAAALAGEPVAGPVDGVGEEDLFAILYTSGTTGRPKGAMLTHLNVIHSSLHWIAAFELGAADRTLLCVPWTHVSGLCGVVMPFLHAGATIVVLREFDRRAALELAAREAITHALMVPAMYGLCLLEPDLAAFALGSWRIAAYGGAPMPDATAGRFAKTFPSLAMCNCYGATETTSPATIMPPGEAGERLDSIGKVVRCGEIRVMDDAGREVVAGQTGELWIAGPMVVPGYWRNEAATRAAFAGGFWKSGDIGSVDAQGYVRIADRKKDMIIRGGFKIYSAELENVLAAIPGVVEAAVVGRPDSMMGETVVAFLCVSDPGLDAPKVRKWCETRVSDYKVPGEVVVSSDPLPRNANGKIQKSDLRRRAAAPAGGVAI